MRRRGNKSHKVPNVKLRPAQPTDSVSRLAQSEKYWAQDSQAGSDDASVLDLCPRPFKNIVVCATGVVDKPTLFKQALELGANSVTAFTDRVTHLVAVDHGGAKYMCALERKIPILSPSWINESYQIWLKGDDVDVAASVQKHRLPIFSNVILCPSGISDITRRTQINKLLTLHGGAYLKNLERPVRVTHLLCSGDEETEKMIYAEKFNQRGEAKIHLVWEEWFWDSLDFGGRFDESRYQVRRPRPERKSLAEAATPPPTSSAQPSELDEELAPLSKERPPPPPQSFDEFDDEAASVKIIPAVTLQMWGGLLQRRGYEIAGGEVIRSPSKTSPKPRKEEEEQPPSPARRGGSVISSFRRANSFAPGAPVSQRPQPFRRTSAAAPEKVGESSTSGAAGPSVVPFFSGLKFCVLGEAKSPPVRTAIERHGGRWVSEEEEDIDFFVVRLLSGSKIYREQADESQRSKYRTECWLERCLHEERVCPVEDHVANVPLAIGLPVPGAESIRMSLSGLDEADSHGIKRLMRALGVVIPSVFSKKATHLLCPSGTGLKFDKAQEWGIPVVSIGWLSAMATSGVVPEVGPYVVARPGDIPTPPPLPAEESIKAHASPSSIKGKGKARAIDSENDMEIDNQMNDITNNTPPDDPAPPKKPLDRQATTLIPQESWSAFGLPNGTLGASAYQVCPSSIKTPSGSNASPVVQYGTRQNSSVLPSAPGSFNSSHNGSNPIVALSNSELEMERKQARIPSSKSPSPMKAPKTGRLTSHSPEKIDCGATKALQESITSLLGKRQVSDDRDEGTALAGPAGKNGKRLRPNRSKVQSRQASDAQIAAAPNPKPGFSGRNTRRSPFDGLDKDELHIGDGQVEESMRVMYEDPDQRDEKKRLMSLLKSQAEDELPVPSGRTRRSTRVAGF